MDLGTLIRILIKRWYVVLPVVILTLATSVQIGRSMKPDYQARGAVLLVGSNVAGGDDVNPLAELRSPLNTTALAISLIATDEQTRAEIRALGFQGTYSVDVTPSTPIVNVRVRARTPEQALLTLEAVIQAVELKLDERQRGVEAPENSLIQTEVLTRTTSARAVFGSRDRAVTVVAGLGLIAAATAAILFNAWAMRRERDDDDDAVASTRTRASDSESVPPVRDDYGEDIDAALNEISAVSVAGRGIDDTDEIEDLDLGDDSTFSTAHDHAHDLDLDLDTDTGFDVDLDLDGADELDHDEASTDGDRAGGRRWSGRAAFVRSSYDS